VSRLWRERILAWLAPGTLAWVRLHRGLRPAAYEKCVIDVDADFGHDPWQGAVQALRTQAESWHADAVDVSLVLSNHFVRYLLVPHAESAGSDEEKLALARFHFSKVHGDVAQDWDIRLSPASGSAPSVASAVDMTLITAIRTCLPEAAPAHLVSVQPWLMAALNTARGRIPQDGAWLLLIEDDRTCLALTDGNAIAAVRNVKGQYSEPQTWPDLIEREQLRIDLTKTPAQLLVQSANNVILPARAAGNWNVTSIEPRWPAGIDAHRDGIYQPALSA
jgi:hypothetical protein